MYVMLSILLSFYRISVCVTYFLPLNSFLICHNLGLCQIGDSLRDEVRQLFSQQKYQGVSNKSPLGILCSFESV